MPPSAWIAIPPTPRRFGTTVVDRAVGGEPVHAAAEHVGEQQRAVGVDGRPLDEPVAGASSHSIRPYSADERAGGAVSGVCRSFSASTRRRSRRRSRCATPTPARSSPTGRAPHPPTTPPRSEQDPRRVVGRARTGARAVCPPSTRSRSPGSSTVSSSSTTRCAVVRPAKLWNDTESAPDAHWLREQARRTTAWAQRVRFGSASPRSRSRSCRGCTAASPTRGRGSARVCLPHDWLTWKLTRRVRDRPRRRVGHRLLLGGATNEYRLDLLAIVDGDVDWPARVAAGARADRRGRRRGRAWSRREPATTWPAALGIALAPGDVAISIGTSGTVFAVSEHADVRRVGRGRRFRRCDRTLPAARLHAERDEGDRRDRRACSASTTTQLDALALAAPTGRGRRHARAVLRR